MRFVGFTVDGAPRLGVVAGDEVLDLTAVDPLGRTDLGAWLAAGALGGGVPTGGALGGGALADGALADGALAGVGELMSGAPARPLEGLTYGLPVARPGKVVCLGLNYLEHAKEGPARDNIPEWPTVFLRCQTSLVPHGAPLVRPRVSETLDYEAELVAVIGRRARHVPVDSALSYVVGYACFNDGSVREFQRRTSQWDMGKNFDGTGGFGPWVVTADELPPGAAGLRIQSRLNGTVMQSASTADMMFPVAQIIADLTRGMTLEPGDLVVTGTPAGVGHARRPPVWMRAGDVCEVEIEGIGVLRNPVVAEPPPG